MSVAGVIGWTAGPCDVNGVGLHLVSSVFRNSANVAVYWDSSSAFAVSCFRSLFFSISLLILCYSIFSFYCGIFSFSCSNLVVCVNSSCLV